MEYHMSMEYQYQYGVPIYTRLEQEILKIGEPYLHIFEEHLNENVFWILSNRSLNFVYYR